MAKTLQLGPAPGAASQGQLTLHPFQHRPLTQKTKQQGSASYLACASPVASLVLSPACPRTQRSPVPRVPGDPPSRLGQERGSPACWICPPCLRGGAGFLPLPVTRLESWASHDPGRPRQKLFCESITSGSWPLKSRVPWLLQRQINCTRNFFPTPARGEKPKRWERLGRQLQNEERVAGRREGSCPVAREPGRGGEGAVVVGPGKGSGQPAEREFARGIDKLPATPC